MSTDRQGNGRVLVAEDEPTLRLATLRLLVSSGYAAEGADDGESAWTALNQEPFDLLITDHSMPRLSGVELLKRLRKANLQLPAIMVSGSMPNEELDRHPWLRLHCRLLKPYSAAELLRRVGAALDPGAPVRGLGDRVRNWFEEPVAATAAHR